ncbi:SpoIIE family protein phosphatase [Kaarinaea lacus]
MSASIFITIVIGSENTVKILSRSLIKQSIDNIEVRLHGFFEPVTRELKLLVSWGQQGLLDVQQPEHLNTLLRPLIEQNKQISSLMVANDNGDEHMLLRLEDKWINRQTRRHQWDARSRWLEWSNHSDQPVESWKALDYDPRRRPWFIGAKNLYAQGDQASSSANWTPPYTFFTTKEPGITISAGYNNGDQWLDVIGIDILLSDISKFTTSLRISERGMVGVLTDQSKIIGLPAHQKFIHKEGQKNALLKTPHEIGIGVISDAAVAYESLPDGFQGPFPFKSAGELWWGGVSPYALDAERNLWIAVVVPEEDLIGNITRMQIVVLLITLLVLLLAVIRAIKLARNYSAPIESLMQQSDRIAQGDLDFRVDIASDIVEVNRLANAQEKMRAGLKSLLKLERDLQIARQIQQNTLPEELPTVVGFQIDAWVDPAEETGGDTYDVVESVFKNKNVEIFNNKKRIMFLLADATGHGIGPALLVTQLRAMLCLAVRMEQPLERIAVMLNKQLYADRHQGRFITAWLAELEPENKIFRSFSAGQAPLLFYSAKRQFVHSYSADTPPLGVLPDLDSEIQTHLEFAAGDIFAVFSDGVFDACNPEGEKFGIQRLIDLIETHHALSANKLLEKIRHSISEFTRNCLANDDRTAVIIKCIG